MAKRATSSTAKTYSQLKAEMAKLESQAAAAMKRERAEKLKEVRKIIKEYGFTHGMVKGALARGRQRRAK